MSTIERISDPGRVRRALNPRAIFALFLTAAALCGCARRYDVTLTNGGRMSNVRKPVLSQEGGYYTCTAANGQKISIPANRVLSVVPHGDKD